MMSAFAGLVGGVASWFATDFVARPIHRFFQMRSEIFQCISFYDNVRAPVDERGNTTDDFDDEDMARLKEAQSKLRQLAMEMQAFAVTNLFASRVVEAFGYAPMNAGQSLVGYSNRIAVYGSERALHRGKVFVALQLNDRGPRQPTS
jgi:hypothetical protein